MFVVGPNKTNFNKVRSFWPIFCVCVCVMLPVAIWVEDSSLGSLSLYKIAIDFEYSVKIDFNWIQQRGKGFF